MTWTAIKYETMISESTTLQAASFERQHSEAEQSSIDACTSCLTAIHGLYTPCNAGTEALIVWSD